MKAADANDFLVSWLWFSLLAQVLDIDVLRADFHRNDDTLSTKKLNTYLSDWTNRAKEAAENVGGHDHAQTSSYVRASIALETARRFVAKYCAHDRMGSFACSIWICMPLRGRYSGQSSLCQPGLVARNLGRDLAA